MRYANTRDRNHAEIVNGLKAAGYAVLDLSRVGGGCPDILVGFHAMSRTYDLSVARKMNILMELKSPEETRPSRVNKKNQADFRASWPGPCYVVSSLEEALAILRGER